MFSNQQLGQGLQLGWGKVGFGTGKVPLKVSGFGSRRGQPGRWRLTNKLP